MKTISSIVFLFMKILLAFFCVTFSFSSVFAAELPVPGVDTSKGIWVGDVKYNADGSMGVGDMKYDKNGASAGDMSVDKDNARAGGLVASGGMKPELTPLKNAPQGGSVTPSSAPVVGGSVTPTASGNIAGKTTGIAGKTLPQTGPKEAILMLIAGVISALMLLRSYRKNAL